MNKTIISGFLGADPIIKILANELKVARFDVAVSKKHKDRSGELVEKTTWFRVEAWGKLADVTEKILRKSDHVLVEGEFEVEKWKDSEGNPKIKYVINPVLIEKLTKKQDVESV